MAMQIKFIVVVVVVIKLYCLTPQPSRHFVC